MQPAKLPEFIAIGEDSELQASTSCMRLTVNGTYHRIQGAWEAAPWWDAQGRLRLMEYYVRPATQREWADSERAEFPYPTPGHLSFCGVLEDLEQKHGFVDDATTVTEVEITRSLAKEHFELQNIHANEKKQFREFSDTWEPVQVTITAIAWRKRDTEEDA